MNPNSSLIMQFRRMAIEKGGKELQDMTVEEIKTTFKDEVLIQLAMQIQLTLNYQALIEAFNNES